MPTVSIITTVYNREQYLAKAIDSFLAQTYTDAELLIWDDGSTDNSAEIALHYAEKDSRINVIAAEHLGRAPALVNAVEATSSPYIGLLDSDDALAPFAIEDTVAILNEFPTVGMVYTDYVLLDEQDQEQGIGNLCHIPYSKDRLLLNFMTFHFRLMRRSVYNLVGGFDETYRYAQDYDICLKFSEVAPIVHLRKPLYFYRHHDSNITVTRHQEQVLLSQRAVNQALMRRGLGNELVFNLRYTNDEPHKAKGILQLRNPINLDNDTAFGHPLSYPRLLNPRVSIIIPTYNRLRYLKRAMWSALRQTLTDYEIIVVDDASTDGTAEWIQQTYPQITLIQLKQNSGGAVARNTGITVARGALIACLDSDDEWSPTFLEQQVKAIDHVSNCSLAYANYIAVVEGQDNVSTISREQRHKDPILAMLLWPFIDSLSLTLIPAHVFERVGLFNEQLRIAYDLELYLRLLKHGKLIHTQQYLVKKHWVHDSLSTQVLGKYRFINELKVINYFFQDPENHPYREYRKQAEKFLKRRSRK